jgi:hypothetical protein
MKEWRQIVAVVVVVVATSWAVHLLSQAAPLRAPAVALLIGAILVALILGFNPLGFSPLKMAGSSLSASSDTYKLWVATAVALGGGAVVLFVLVWSLIKIVGTTPPLDNTIGLPLILIAGLTVLLIVIGLVTFTFSVVGLSSPGEALGLPDGSVRAIIALMLLVLFSIMSIFLYNSIQSRQLQTLSHITQRGVENLRSHAMVLLQQPESPPSGPTQNGGTGTGGTTAEPPKPPTPPSGGTTAEPPKPPTPLSGGTTAEPPKPPTPPSGGTTLEPPKPPTPPSGGTTAELLYTVTFQEQNGPADDIAKQLIVMLGTLVTAVASFYFGSASVASANAAVRGQILRPPTATTISPNPIAATGVAQTLTIAGSNLGNVSKLHLEQKGRPDIDATLAKVTDTSLTAQITILTGSTNKWDVVVNEGAQAVTIGTIDVAPAAAPQAGDAATPQQPKTDAGTGGSSDNASNLVASGQASPALAAPFTAANVTVSPTINAAFLGHGMFLEYSPITTLQRYAAYDGADPIGATTVQLVQRFIKAMQDMHVASVWIQLFTASGVLDSGSGGTSELVAGLKQAGIEFAGWGYCYSGNAATDAGLAKHLCQQYGINAFIADVEPGNTVHGGPDTWQPTAFNNLIAGLKGTFGKDNLGISTFGSLIGHQDAAAIYKLAINDVALFAPQVYWYTKAPVAYMQQCIASFRQAGIGNPLVGTAQAYWEIDKNGGVSRPTMETQVNTFATNFADWGKLIGLNWYHAGNANTDASGAMSDAMITSIAKARLDQKPFATPAAVDGSAVAA